MNLTGPIQELLASSTVPLLSAFLLGLLVALSPCPLATNLAALAYIGRRATAPMSVLAEGALYALGRAVSYTVLTALLVLISIEVSQISWFLQDVGQYFLGPLLVVVGLMVLGLIPLRLPSVLPGRARLGQRLAEAGPLGAFGLGALFALAFCPYSAALFFGVLLPLAVGTSGGIALAPAFALGTSLPVLLLAVLVSVGVARFLGWIEATSKVELWLRRITGILFVIAGLYLTAASLWVP